MSGLFGGSSKNAGGGYNIVGGGTGAPWTWGVSDFDQSMIDAATAGNTSSMENRYSQLGLGGSTPEIQDEGSIATQGEALTGQEQTANVGQPALNPALQPQLNSLIGVQTGNQNSSSLSSLAGAAGKLLAGGAAALGV